MATFIKENQIYGNPILFTLHAEQWSFGATTATANWTDAPSATNSPLIELPEVACEKQSTDFIERQDL